MDVRDIFQEQGFIFFTSPRRFARWVAACGSGVALLRLRGEVQLPLRPRSGGGRGGCPPTSRVPLAAAALHFPFSLPSFHVPPSLPRVSPPAPLVCFPHCSQPAVPGNNPGRLPPGCQDSRGRQKHRWGVETSLTPGPASPAPKKGPWRNMSSQVVTHPLPTGPRL